MQAKLQRCPAGHHEPGVVPPIVHDVLATPGQPLDGATRAFMEPRFGHDFSGVRVHTDGRAAESAQAVNALAYTVGPHIAFGAGKYAPRTGEGRYLLAHELTHVVQQSNSPSQLQQALPISQPGDPYEQEADSVAKTITTLSPTDVPHNVPIHPTGIRLGAKGLYRAITTGCFAPSEIIIPTAASVFGDAAEAIIIMDFCSKMGCRPMATNHFDNRVFGAMSYIAFLAAHNPGLSTADVITLAILSQIELNRPDILTHTPALQDFDEIKPNSITGRAAGVVKVGWLSAFFPHWSLPYVPAVAYTPTPEIMLASGHVGPWPLEVFLRVQRQAPGLIVYDLCARGELAKIGLAALLAILAAIIIILSRGRVRIPIPIPSPVLAANDVATDTDSSNADASTLEGSSGSEGPEAVASAASTESEGVG